MKRIIKQILKDSLRVEAEISLPRNKDHGDYSSNVILKNKLSLELIEELLPSDLLESYEVINGHLNLFVKVDLQPCFDGPVLRILEHRMKSVCNRLMVEGYTQTSKLEGSWLSLSKAYNLLNQTQKTFGSVKSVEIEALIKTFEDLDYGYIYRNDSSDQLAAIVNLLAYCISLLERVIYE